MDNVISLNNTKFRNYFDRTYLTELEINDTTDTARNRLLRNGEYTPTVDS
jgi:hypothetical protein